MISTVEGIYQTGMPTPRMFPMKTSHGKLPNSGASVSAPVCSRAALPLHSTGISRKLKTGSCRLPLNDILGYEESAMINGGGVENRGVEPALSWNDNIGGDFLYHVNVNATYNRNRVTRLATASGKIGDDASGTLFENSSYVSLVEVGHPIGYFSGMSHSGIWQTQQQIDDARAAGRPVLPSAQPGDFIWDDYNNDGVISLGGDRHEIGDPNPDWTLGVNLGFSYKGFDFSATGSASSECRQCSAIARLFLPTRISTTQPTFLMRWHG